MGGGWGRSTYRGTAVGLEGVEKEYGTLWVPAVIEYGHYTTTD